MQKNYYKKIEYDLYNYNMYKIAIENLKKEIDYLKNSDEVRSVGGISYDDVKVSETHNINKIVEDAALSIHESIQYKERTIEGLENKIAAIDRVLEGLTETERDIMVKRYINGYQWWEVERDIGYSDRHCKRIRRTAIKKMIIGVYGK